MMPSVGPYKVLDQLGAGGMGQVYLAEDDRLRRLVALKRLTDEHAGDADARARILHEARAIAKIHHSGIATVYDVIEDNEAAWIVMEYVSGETLAARLRRGRMPLPEAIDFGSQMAEALAEAHAHGVLHCDLKPSNVLVTPEGKTKLLDFGLARGIHASSATEETREVSELTAPPGRLTGSAGYLAPERLSGARVDERGDVYSLGVILYEMVTGRRPFSGGDMVSIAATALTSAPEAPAAIDPAVPRAVSDVVLKALASNPAMRFQTAAELAQAWKSALAGEPPKAARRPRRRILWVAVSIIAIGASFVGLAFREGWLPRNQTLGLPRITPVVVKPFENLSGDPTNDYLGIGLAEDVISRLSRLPFLTVVSRSAFNAYLLQGKRRDAAFNPAPAMLARDLGVAMVVEGTFQRRDDRLHVTVSVLDKKGVIQWSDQWDMLLHEQFALQRRVAEALGSALNPALTDTERQRLARQPTSSVEAFADYTQGQIFLDNRDKKGSIDTAIALFQSALRKDPVFAKARAGLGAAYWEKYNETKDQAWTTLATDASDTAVRLDSEESEVHVTRGLIFKGRGLLPEAEQSLRRALQIQSNSDDAHRLLGDVLDGLGQTDRAFDEYQAAISIRPEFWQNYNRLGDFLQTHGRFAEAASAYRRVTELQPDSGRGYNNLGVAMMQQGDLINALANLTHAADLEASWRASAYSNIGTIHLWQGRFDLAQSFYQKAIDLRSNVATLHRNLGDALAAAHDWDRAQKEYQVALDYAKSDLVVNPTDAKTISLVALLEVKLRQPDRARPYINDAVARASEDQTVRYREAAIAALGGDSDRALKALQKAIALGRSRFEAANDPDLQILHGRPEFEALIRVKGK